MLNLSRALIAERKLDWFFEAWRVLSVVGNCRLSTLQSELSLRRSARRT
jgi:hypothetical protein